MKYDMVDAKTLGSAIKALRGERQMSQIALAQAAGLRQSYIVAIEHGDANLTIEKLNALAAALKVPAGCLAILGTKSVGKHREMTDLLGSIRDAVMVTARAYAKASKAAPSTTRMSSTTRVG